jgi:GNAT superfamily N-acetyltransferase
MLPGDFDEVAELIFLSTNSWYLQNLGHPVFSGKPEDCRIFCEVYEDLDEGGGLVVINERTGRIVGSCFVHPRETHISLGILNVHPIAFGQGIAGIMLKEIKEMAETKELPLRLVSSALSLDSFSLYNRAGFTPIQIYQDMMLEVPKRGLPEIENDLPSVREAELVDLMTLGQLEFEISGISREKDYCYFLENSSGHWQTLVSENEEGEVDGFLVSIDHPAIRMIGPGAVRNVESFEALLRAQIDRFRGNSVVFLLPSDQPDVVKIGYELGAKNCELHFAQVIGDAQPIQGIAIPTFLPESA